MAEKGENEERKLVMSNWATLSNELKVAVKIQVANDRGETPYFNALAKELSAEGISSTTVHNVLDHLIDLGTISADWVKVGSRWVRRFYISGESQDFIKSLIKELYK